MVTLERILEVFRLVSVPISSLAAENIVLKSVDISVLTLYVSPGVPFFSARTEALAESST
ncbi:MAG: hypothetical protein QXZ17_12910 [Nitrososphaerota archaeon]